MLETLNDVFVSHGRLDSHLLLLEHHLLTVELGDLTFVHLHLLQGKSGATNITGLFLGERLGFGVLDLVLHHLNALFNSLTLRSQSLKRLVRVNLWLSRLLGLATTSATASEKFLEHLLFLFIMRPTSF